MPTNPTFPGVYIEEIPSGVHTITGVSTSVTAFVGSAKRGAINEATHILSFSDFERLFGGLQSDSEMSYAVRQFFLNGGSDAWVVRLAKNAQAASLSIDSTLQAAVLVITALDEGFTGNDIEVRIDYNTASPASTFNLTLNFVPADDPSSSFSEAFTNLSMNSQDPRYAPSLIAASSKLVTAERDAGAAAKVAAVKGGGVGGTLTDDVGNLLDANHNQIQVSVNGSPPVPIILTVPPQGNSAAARLLSVCNEIQGAVQFVGNQTANAALSGFLCAPDGGNKFITMTSGLAGEASSVRVTAGARNDASARLKLGALNGGTETDAVAGIRPFETPPHGTLASDTITPANISGAQTNTDFQISLDGYGPDTVTVDKVAAQGGGANLKDRLGILATQIQAQVTALKPSNPAYRDFTCVVGAPGNNFLLLSSGTRGTGSSVSVSPGAANDVSGDLHLIAGATTTHPLNAMLQGGNESPYTPADQYNLFIADRSKREGIYALEAVDIFNLLCLPGVTDSGILMDASSYCQERRAFLIADAPADKVKPDDMVQTISGPALPKTNYGAVYYPWLQIADPLKNGQLRSTAPSGTVAGLYARIDSTRGVWKAPAGTEATLVGAQGMAYKLTDLENGTLNPLGVNCLRIFPVFGAIAWGARTLQGADQMASEYKYVPIRRLALYIEESLYRGSKWIVFEPNDEPLWAQIRLNFGAFMQTLFRQGAFQGSSPKDAYFVKCDNETTTQDDINRGVVNILVGFAPLKPAEFVIIKVQQMAGQIQT
jgi:phage tail sheath protein FI